MFKPYLNSTLTKNEIGSSPPVRKQTEFEDPVAVVEEMYYQRMFLESTLFVIEMNTDKLRELDCSGRSSRVALQFFASKLQF